MMDKTPGGRPLYSLYRYTHRENGKSYIGITGDLAGRRKRHARGRSAALAFNRAVNKYGIDAFDFKILAIFDDANAANYHENAAIESLRALTPNGYNLCGGAPKSKYFGPLSEETKRKIGNGNRGKIRSLEEKERNAATHRGRIAWNKGKPFSQSTRLKMSIAKKGKKPSPEHLAKQIAGLKLVRDQIANSLRGRHLSPEHRAAISRGNKGKKKTFEQRMAASQRMKGKKPSEKCLAAAFTPEARLKRAISRTGIIQKNRGRPLSPEQRVAISRGSKGKIISPEQRNKISNSLKRYYDKKRKS